MQIYNAGGIDHTSRFILALVVGLLGSIGLGILYGMVQTLLRIEFEYVYILIGWLIGEMIRKLGHGVTKKYNVLGAVLAFVAVLTGDIVVRYGMAGLVYVFRSPSLFLSVFASVLNSFRSVWGIFGVIFRVLAMYIAYQRATVL
jgi:hypothetical protein